MTLLFCKIKYFTKIIFKDETIQKHLANTTTWNELCKYVKLISQCEVIHHRKFEYCSKQVLAFQVLVFVSQLQKLPQKMMKLQIIVFGLVYFIVKKTEKVQKISKVLCHMPEKQLERGNVMFNVLSRKYTLDVSA